MAKLTREVTEHFVRIIGVGMLTECNPRLVSRHAPSKQNATRVQERILVAGTKIGIFLVVFVSSHSLRSQKNDKTGCCIAEFDQVLELISPFLPLSSNRAVFH